MAAMLSARGSLRGCSSIKPRVGARCSSLRTSTAVPRAEEIDRDTGFIEKYVPSRRYLFFALSSPFLPLTRPLLCPAFPCTETTAYACSSAALGPAAPHHFPSKTSLERLSSHAFFPHLSLRRASQISSPLSPASCTLSPPPPRRRPRRVSAVASASSSSPPSSSLAVSPLPSYGQRSPLWWSSTGPSLSRNTSRSSSSSEILTAVSYAPRVFQSCLRIIRFSTL